MGQKVNPIGFRLGVNQRWASNWYTDKGQKEFINEDAKIRRFLAEKIKTAGLSRTEITRTGKNSSDKDGTGKDGAGKDGTDQNLQVTAYVGRPGMVFGRKGENLDKVKNSLRKYIKREKLELHIKEVKRPETDAKLIAINVANQLEKRFSFRRVIKKAIQNARRSSVAGCKIMVSGRLNGAEMARTEWLREGRVPLHTIRHSIDYATHEAKTTYGVIGVKVWVFQGEIRKHKQ